MTIALRQVNSALASLVQSARALRSDSYGERMSLIAVSSGFPLSPKACHLDLDDPLVWLSHPEVAFLAREARIRSELTAEAQQGFIADGRERQCNRRVLGVRTDSRLICSPASM